MDGTDVDLGMNLPVMARGMDRATTHAWCRGIDTGPWRSLALGERINFHNPEAIATLATAAALTDRVRLVTNVLVLPSHEMGPDRSVARLAKQLATVDALSDGRLEVGVGVGGRDEDYLATGADPSGARLARMQADVEELRRLWSGGLAHADVLRPVEPFPVQRPGPPVLVGALGPKSIARAAHYADGIIGFSFMMGEDELRGAFDLARRAWRDAGRDTPPRLVTGCFFALGHGADGNGPMQMRLFLEEYLNFLGELAQHVVPTATVTDADRLVEVVERAAALGADELLLTPSTAALGELAEAAVLLDH